MSENENEIYDTIENEIEERETINEGSEEAQIDPKELAVKMLKEGRPIEEIIEKTGLPPQVVYGLKGSLVKRGELEEEGGGTHSPEEEEEGEEPIFKSPKEQLEEWFIDEISKRLPEMMTKKYAELVIKTLVDNPEIIWDPQALRYHIIQIYPKINKYLLDWTLNSLYRKLNELRSNYEGAPYFSIPISPPQIPELPPSMSMSPPRQRSPQFSQYGSNYFYPTQQPYMPPQQYYHPPERRERDDSNKVILTALAEIIKKLEEKEKEPLVEVPNPFGEGMIKVPASQAPIYYMMKTMMDQLKKLSEDKNKEPIVKIPTEDGKIIELPASQAAYYVIAQAEKEKRRLLEKSTEKLIEKYSPERILRAIEESSLQRSASPTLDLINKARQDLNKLMDRILTVIEAGMRYQGALPAPQVPKYSPEEREKKIEAVEEAIEEAQERARLENEITELVPYVVGGEEEESEEEKQ